MMKMNIPLTLILSFLLFLSVQDVLNAQSPILNSGFVTISAETQEEPYRSEFFRVRGIPDLQVNIPSGEIEVVHNPQINGVKVELYVKRGFSLWSGTRSLDTYRIIIQQRGDQVIASVEDTRPKSSGVNIDFYFVIQVPGEISTNLRSINGGILLDGVMGRHFLQSQVGDLTVKNSEGDIRVVTTTGNIKLDNLAGNIFAKSVSGHVHVVNNTGEIRLRSVAGNITAENITGTLVTATTAGDINAVFNEVSMGIYMETVSGNINLSVPPSAGYNIQAKALRFNFDELHPGSVTSRNIRSREAAIIVRDGELPVTLTTTTGRVSVRESNK